MLCSRRIMWRRKLIYYLRCGAKITTFLFWAALYFIAMKLTVFKSTTAPPEVKDWQMLPDNYTKWLYHGPVLGEDILDENVDYGEGSEHDNLTCLEIERRVERVLSVCQLRHLPSDKINNKEFFVDHVHNIVWCNIFKAASSSWLYKFNILGGYDKKFLSRTKQTPLMLARKKFPRPSIEELRDAVTNPGVISLLVVREPFVRLLSAYRDKLENKTPPFYRKLAKDIVSKYREQATRIFGPLKTYGPTFYEFVAYLINEHKEKTEDSFNEHWTPYYQFCSPCAVNYTVIAKVETLQRDSAYVIRQLGLGHVLGPLVKDRKVRLRTVMNKSRDGRNTTSLLKYYFKQLDENMLNDLLEIYGTDFEMFGYDPTVYSSYIKK